MKNLLKRLLSFSNLNKDTYKVSLFYFFIGFLLILAFPKVLYFFFATVLGFFGFKKVQPNSSKKVFDAYQKRDKQVIDSIKKNIKENTEIDPVEDTSHISKPELEEIETNFLFSEEDKSNV